MSGDQTRATRIDPALLREVAALEPDAARRDEMAGPSYLHPIPFVRWVFWQRLDAVTRFLAIDAREHRAGLDFGCGLGVLLPTLGAVTQRLYATDLALAPARRLVDALNIGNVSFVDPAELERRIVPASLDYVVATDVLEHVADLPVVVGQLHALMKPGGRLVVSGPTENTIYKLGRVLAGFGGKGGYHRTDIQRIHAHITRRGGGFVAAGRRVLPLPRLVEAFYIYSYRKSG
jgi:2-polyprenyl-3-methyl-5-hydroxy-6-metoxy-1,4-benzoquinol methylase